MQRIRHNSQLVLKSIFLGLMLFIFSSTVKAQMSGSYTIDASTATGGRNYQSFTEAVFALADGVSAAVVFDVVPGVTPYSEQIIIPQITGSSATNTITFNCNGAVLEFLSTSSVSRAGVKLDGADYITFDSLYVKVLGYTETFEYGYGFHLLRDADHNTIRRCTVDNKTNLNAIQNNEGIVINSSDEAAYDLGASLCDSNLITENTVIGGYDGIILNSGTPFEGVLTRMNGNQITKNKIQNNHSTGIYLSTNYGTLIEDNDISNTINQSAMGIWVVEDNSGIKINGNRIHNVMTLPGYADFSTYIGINVGYSNPDPSDPIIISNNLIYDIRNNNDQTAISLDNGSYMNVFHNSILLNDVNSIDGNTTIGFQRREGNNHVKFQDNIVVVTRSGPGTNYAVTIDKETDPLLTDYNDLVASSIGGSAKVVKHTTGSYATLLAWQTTVGRDYHSVSVDPVFADPASGNLEPTLPNLDNTGFYVGIDRDIRDTGRSNTYPDMGAYEFLSIPCSVPPIGGTSLSVPGTLLCSGTAITLNLLGNSAGLNQTYQWQTSTTSDFASFNDISTEMVAPAFDVTANTPLYYRAKVVCASQIAYSMPVQVIANGLFPAGTYSINSTQPTGGTNFASFADALAVLKCGIAGPIVFNVTAGTGPYNEQVLTTTVLGVSATNTVTFNGNGETLTYRSTNSSQRAVLKFDGTDYFSFDNFIINATGANGSDYGYGVQFINDADFNTVKNCTITVDTKSTSKNYSGFVMSASASNPIGTGAANGCDNNTIENNTITGGFYGFTLVASTSLLANNNVIKNNTIKDFYSFGMYITGTNNTLIEGNDISRPTRDNLTWFYGMYIESKSTGLNVSKNKIHNTYDKLLTTDGTTYGAYITGCDATSASPNIFSDNLLYNFNGISTQYGIYNSSSDYWKYYHNTISLDDSTAATVITTTRGIHQTSNATGLEFKNNNITIRRGGTGINHAFYMNATGSTYTADNNNYYVASATGTNNIAYASSTSYATIAAWKTASSKDANSISADPVYANPSTGDFSPTVDSLDNKGTPTIITTDINGVVRSTTTPDIGAYEFVAGVVPVNLVNVSAVRIADDVVVNWTSATEINSKSFVVERSLNGRDFTAIATENAKGGSGYQQYSIKDITAAATASAKIYYRIKMVDRDGRTEYSKIVFIQTDKSSIEAVSVYPNPFVSALSIRINTLNAGNATIDLKDVTGRLLIRKNQQLVQGTNIFNMGNVNQLQGGVYLISVEINGSKYVSKVIK